ncbi:MAG: hypothetical protein ACOYJG_12585 [Prevotella sp.]|jgi:hypothetical protein
MKLQHLLLSVLACFATGAEAQTTRTVHGVNGYYNYTARQLQSMGDPFTYWDDGTKLKAWYRDIQYDGDYMVLYPGINNTTRQSYTSKIGGNSKTITQQGFDWMIGINLFHDTYPLKITKEYPVIAIKMSVPYNVIDSVNSTVRSSFFWVNPYTGANERMKGSDNTLSGVGSDGICHFLYKYPGVGMNLTKYADYGAKDSISFCGWDARGHKKDANTGIIYDIKSHKNIKTGEKKDTAMVFMYLPESANEKANFIVLLNYYSIPNTASSTTTEKHLLDSTNITIPHLNFTWYGTKDTLNADGSTISSDQRPVAYFKWLKTFKSIGDAVKSITAANNWGDGTESTAKVQLNYSLYYAEQALSGFKFLNSDPDNPDNSAYITYQNAYNNALAVYNNESSTDDQLSSANDALQAARIAFNQAVDLPSSLVYNFVKSATGNGGIVIAASESTVNGTTGKALTIGSNDAASPLSFVATGNVINGQKTYTLKSGNAAVVQASDGTLLLVDSVAGSTFTFSERDIEGPSFDVHCGDYYYYLDQNGVLSITEEIPEEATSDFDALSPYLFTMEDAVDDYAASASEEEKTGLLAGWEFNDTPVDDPSTKGTVDGVEKTMAEYGETKMVEGWRMSRWKAYSRVNQETVQNSDNTSATCLVLTSASTYDNWDGSETGIVNDFSNSAAMRLDHGTENPFYVCDPKPRDSVYAYNMNAGINRYFAIKMKGTSDVKFGTLTFLGANTVIIKASQLAGQKGDVYYWDLLNSGFTVGKNLYTSAFFSPEGFTSADSKLYIDWMRTYSSIDEIPEESFADNVANGITTVKAADATGKFVVNGRTVEFFDGGQVYSIDGSLVANVKGHGTVALVPGVYLVKGGEAVSKVVVR